MGDSKRDVTDPQTVHKETCWQHLLKSQVAVFCKGLAGSRPAMFLNALLALSPVADILSDLLTAASFAYNGHAWWSAITLGIFYLSGRFTVMFMALCPTPSAWNLFCLYLPGCWQLRTLPPDEDDPAERGFPAPPTHGPVELKGPAPVHGGAATTNASNGDAHVPPPSRAAAAELAISKNLDKAVELLEALQQGMVKPKADADQQAPATLEEERRRRKEELQQSLGEGRRIRKGAELVRLANLQVFEMAQNGFTWRVRALLQGHENRVLHKECPYSCNLCSCSVWFTWPRVCLQSLWMEILLIPIACLAVIPIGVSAYQLSSSYLRAALGRADVSGDSLPGGSDPVSAPISIHDRVLLFLKTVSIVEALLESAPQLALQIRTRFYGEQELEDWVFLTTFSVSVLCVVHAIAKFLQNRAGILETLLDLGKKLEGELDEKELELESLEDELESLADELESLESLEDADV